MKRKERALAELEEQMLIWRERCPVGTTVAYRELQDGPVTLVAKTRSEVEILSGHTIVVWLDGKVGCVCADHCEIIRRMITPEQEAGLAAVGWSWERYGGMVNCFPQRTSWDCENPEANACWVQKGFTAPRELFFQTPVQKAAPDLLVALEKVAQLAADRLSIADGFFIKDLIARARGGQA